jgi:hypothetical protein
MLYPAEIVAENLDAVIQHASVILRASNRSSSSRRISRNESERGEAG